MKTMYLYGISGAENGYRVVRYTCIDERDFSVMTINYEAAIMRRRYPSIEHVYILDNRRGLGECFMRTFKENSIDGWISFKDILEREGLQVF